MANSNRSVRAEYWQGVLEQFRQSDLSAPVFCKEKGIPIASFYQWRRRLQVSHVSSTNAIVPVKIIPVQFSSNTSTRLVQIITPSGFSLRIDPAMSADALAQLLRTIESSTE